MVHAKPTNHCVVIEDDTFRWLIDLMLLGYLSSRLEGPSIYSSLFMLCVYTFASVVNRPVRPELGRNGAVIFEAGRNGRPLTVNFRPRPSPAVIGRHPLMICESSYIIDIQL